MEEGNPAIPDKAVFQGPADRQTEPKTQKTAKSAGRKEKRGNKKSARSSEQQTPSAVILRRQEDARFRADLDQLLQRIVLIGLAAWLFLTRVFLLTQARGQGMFPAVKDGDLVFAYRLEADYEKDDIVVCTLDGREYIGRIAGRSNDVIDISDSGTLTVNGTVQTGEIIYPTTPGPGIEYPYRIPEGSLFLLGDNRTSALDSRSFGPVSLRDVKGKLITILRRRQL